MGNRVNPANWKRSEYVKFYLKTWRTAVVPVGSNKTPQIKWGDLNQRQNTPDELQEISKNTWGLAVVMGHPMSPNLFSVDIDSEEMFLELRQKGAFPKGACIARSKNRHYHVVMRANTPPKTVAQHTIDGFDAVKICGVGSLAILPDTPGREWLELYNDPIAVNLEEWAREYLGYDYRATDSASSAEITLKCIFHDDRIPSLCVNVEKQVFYCHGCGRGGTLEKLLAEAKLKGVRLPDSLLVQTPSVGDTETGFRVDWRDLNSVVGSAGQDIIEGLLPGGSQGKLFISGERKLGKTTLGLTLGMAVAQGKPALGKRPTIKSRVLFVDLEGTAQSVADVVRKQVRALGEPEPAYFDVVGGLDFKVTKPESMLELWRLLRRQPAPQVVILDSIYALVTDMNDMQQVTTVLEFLTNIINKLGAAVIILHHVSDPSELIATKKPLGVLGRQLDRWSGVTATYTSAGKEGSYYRVLDGIRRGGQGKLKVYLAYVEDFQLVIEIDWEDVPGNNEERKALLGPNPRTLVVQQVCNLAKLVGVTKAQLAEEWEVDVRQILRYQNEENLPSDEVFERIHATQEELRDRIGIAVKNGPRHVQTTSDARPILGGPSTQRGKKEASSRLPLSTVNVNNRDTPDSKHTTGEEMKQLEWPDWENMSDEAKKELADIDDMLRTATLVAGWHEVSSMRYGPACSDWDAKPLAKSLLANRDETTTTTEKGSETIRMGAVVDQILGPNLIEAWENLATDEELDKETDGRFTGRAAFLRKLRDALMAATSKATTVQG